MGLLLCLALAAAYVPALRAGYIWDDADYVTENPLLESAEGLVRIWTEPRASPQYYPVVFTTFWVERRLWDERPFGYHLVNVLLHGANAVLLAFALGRLGVRGAWLAAWVFALHPVQVESVAWVTERKNVLSGLFYLATFLAYLRHAGVGQTGAVAPSAEGPARGGGWYWASMGLFQLALWSKSVTATLPAAVLLVLWWQRGRIARREAAEMVPFLVLGAAWGLHTAWLEKFHVGALGEEWAFSWVERVLIAGRAVAAYLGKLAWPAELAFFYPRWEVDASEAGQYLFPAGFAAAAALLWLGRRRVGRGPLAALLYFAGTLFPALGFLNVYPMMFSFVADHFQYLASIGPIALASAGLAGVSGRLSGAARAGVPRGGLRAPLVPAAALLALLGALTWERCHAFRDQEALWRDTIEKNPGAWLAHNNLGNVLLDQGRREEAAAHYRESLRLRPTYWEPVNNLGVILALEGKAEEAEAQLRRAASLHRAFWEPRLNLGNLLRDQGRAEEAEGCYREALEIKEDEPAVHYNLALLLAKGGRAEEAVVHYRRAIDLDPGSVPSHYDLGVALDRLGRAEEAAAQYRTVVERDPSHVEALNNLASHLGTAGDLAEAARLFARAAALRPEDPQPRVNLARALAGQGRVQEAASQYREALRLAPEDGGVRQELERLLSPPAGSP